MGGEAGSTPKASTSSRNSKPQQEYNKQQEKQQQAVESRAAQTSQKTTKNQWGKRCGCRRWGRRLRLCSRLFLWIQAKFATISHGLSEVSFEGPGFQSHHQKFNETISKRGRKNKNCGGRVKKCEIMGNPAGERIRRRGVRERAQILDAPTKILNTHRTDTPQHNTTQHHTTQRGIPHRVVLGKGSPVERCWAAQGGPWPNKQDMINKFRRAAPLAKVFWGQQKFGYKTVWSKKRAKRRSGSKWCGPKVVRKKLKNESTKIPLAFTPKNKMHQQKKNPKNQKMKNISLPPFPNQKVQNKQKINKKIKNWKNV